ncbi:DENN domain-containing protein 10-like [Saccoglossus kowalevskii]|uniref:Protein FAM45A-like n=1 Tax=Saccoglossus kowalevskii TaxID=10224 RepID=A0ABM0GVR6_SACKO|nr:PREDICTED: protein FAM45A-like [Saccoglossus kowalevskii]
MAVLTELQGVGLIEKDTNSDVLWTWSYPSISGEKRDLLMKKCCLKRDSNEVIQLVFGQHGRQWYYIYTTEVEDIPVLSRVKYFSLVLLSKDYNPEKYKTLCQILSKLFLETGNPATMLQGYLSVLTKGSCTCVDNGTFAVEDHDARKSYIASSIKDVIRVFGVETILIYTALILKKRVAVYHSKLEELLQFTRALPTLVWHRQNWNILYPYVHLDEEELTDVKSTTNTYIIGSLDSTLETRNDLYDIFINVPHNEIIVATHVKESFNMGKIHKDIAQLMVQSAQDEDKSDQQIIKEIAVKTKDLINNLKTLATPSEDGGTPKITLEALQERQMPPAMENFLFNLAAAEGFVQF